MNTVQLLSRFTPPVPCKEAGYCQLRPGAHGTGKVCFD
jgi:hypothetical protein